ncbi:unnamed protein product, partial [Ectocarpus sp. 13 AM-2016]
MPRYAGTTPPEPIPILKPRASPLPPLSPTPSKPLPIPFNPAPETPLRSPPMAAAAAAAATPPSITPPVLLRLMCAAAAAAASTSGWAWRLVAAASAEPPLPLGSPDVRPLPPPLLSDAVDEHDVSASDTPRRGCWYWRALPVPGYATAAAAADDERDSTIPPPPPPAAEEQVTPEGLSGEGVIRNSCPLTPATPSPVDPNPTPPPPLPDAAPAVGT